MRAVILMIVGFITLSILASLLSSKRAPKGQNKTHSSTRYFLISVATMGLLAMAVSFPYPFIRPRSRGGGLMACKSNLKNIGTALEMYSTHWDGHYPQKLNSLTPNYLKTIPECPQARKPSYYSYQTGPNCAYNTGFEDYYFLKCSGTHHSHVGVPPNYPQYDGIQGLIER